MATSRLKRSNSIMRLAMFLAMTDFFVSACAKGTHVFYMSKFSGSEYQVPTSTGEDGSTNGSVTNNAVVSQRVTAGSASGVDGDVVFPAGSLSINVSIGLNKGDDFASSEFAGLVGAGSSFSSKGISMSVKANPATDALNPMQISLPAPSATALSLLLDSDDKWVVLFQLQKMSENGKFWSGLIPRSELKVQNGKVIVSTKHFGTYQVVATTALVEKAVALEGKVADLVAAVIPTVAIDAPSAVYAKTGDSVDFGVTYTGAKTINLTADDITIGGAATATKTILNGTTATPTVRVTGFSGDGALTISVAAGKSSNSKLGVDLGAGPSAVVTVDNTLPLTPSLSPSSATYNGTRAMTFAQNSTVDATFKEFRYTTSGTAPASCSDGTASSTSYPATGTANQTIIIVACDHLGQMSSSSASATLTYDVTAPTLSVSAPSASSAISTATITYTVTYTGADTITLSASDVTLNTTSGASASKAVSCSSATCTVTLTSLTGNGTIGISVAAGTASDLAGNLSLAAGPSTTFTVDATPPTISFTSISPTSPGTSQTPSVTLSLTEATSASGLGLYSNVGCSASIATAVTGTSGSNVVTTTSLTANQTTAIYAKATDVAGNVSSCTSMVSYVHDNAAPTVTAVTSTKSDGSYKVGEVIGITVTFSESVTVTGTPQLTLETGGTDALVNYTSGSPGTVLTFNYTVAASETSADLDYASTTALALNSGTIRDASLNNATLTLVAPSTTTGATIANGKAIVIDTTAPTVAFSSVSVSNPGSTLTPTILGTGSETSTVTLYYDASCVTAKSAGTANTTFASPGIAVNANAGSNTTTTIYGIAVDTALNASACTSLVTYTHDNVAPVVSVSAGVSSATANGSYKQSGVIAITVTFSESVTVTGTPQLTLETGGSDAVVDYTSGSGSTVLVFNYTVGATHTSADLDYASTAALALNSGTINDSALNAATLTLATVGAASSLGANNNFVIDTTVPTITYSSISPTSPGASQTPAVTLSLSEASGTTGLGLYSESGCTTSIATAVTGTSGSNAVTTTTLTPSWTTTIYAKATDVAGNVSTCTSMVSYTHAPSWSATTSTSAPGVAYYQSGVWTGSKMIVWGGTTNGTSGINTGGLYDPVANAWTATTSTSVPVARMNHTAVWTGAHMIVWGGTTTGGYIAGLNTGAKYDPVLNSWTATTSTSAPAARYRHVSVWTGSKMVVWGGYNNAGDKLSTGSRYDPYTNVWTATAGSDSAPLSHDGAAGAVAVWTGSKMLFYGGILQSSGDPIGGLYDPVGDTWTATTSTSAPSRCAGVDCLGEAGVWTGSKLIVWGRSDQNDVSTAYNTGAIYDVAGNSWTTTTTTSAPSARSYHSAVWTGAKMVIFGGCNGGSCGTKLNDAFEYNPVTNAWAATTTTSAPAIRSQHTAVWTGSQMLIWGGATTSDVAVNSGGAYSPQFQTYTTGSGNFTVPTGVTSVIVEVWGAGGGGGAGGTGGSGQGAAGGGGGGYTRKTLTVSAGQTIGYVVGAGGAGNPTADSAAAGTTGGLSSATYSGTTYTANGGVGGVGDIGTGVVGTGGTATNGDENRTGGSGSLKYTNNGGGGGSSAGSGSNGTNAPAASITSQPGGTPPQGGGFGGYGGNQAGGSGVSPGGGGGGGAKDLASGGGGNGANGAVSFHYSATSSCSGGGVSIGGHCWYASGTNASCSTACSNVSLTYNAATLTYAGSDGTLAQCNAVIDGVFGGNNTVVNSVGPACFTGAGCGVDGINYKWCNSSGTTDTGSAAGFNRVCACQ